MVITPQPDFQVELGKPLILICTVVATGLTEITWDGSGLANTDIELVTNLSTGVSTLTIHAVSASDLDHYSCEAVAGSIERNDSATITTNSKCVIVLMLQVANCIFELYEFLCDMLILFKMGGITTV